jgi:TldD protein
MANRASLSPELLPVRDQLPALIPLLEARPGWYGSVLLERKASRTWMANLRQTNMTDQVSLGAVLRIYDGFTLFEQATDELDAGSLAQAARRLADRAARATPPAGAPRRDYRPPTWAERLREPLDPELTEQIPASPRPDAWVHFGIRYRQDPLTVGAQARFDRLRDLIARARALAPECGLKPEDLTYIMARQGFAHEESVFVDRETRMSQTLYRLSIFLVTMCGADRTMSRAGGLGGTEAMELPDEALREQLRDLAALQKAERLEPGRYRVLFGPETAGVLAHEAFGHSQEGDTCARGRSKAWDLHLSGESVGNELATILNNPAIYRNADSDVAAWGSYFFDEEGWLAREQVLLDRGKLRAPMTNLTSAIRLGVPRTANGKRESWANGVYTRQTNTYFSAGDLTLDEIMRQLGDGFLANQVAGGMEDPKGMGIQVGIQYLQEVKGGKLTGRVFKGPAGGDIQMTGYTPDVLSAIVAKTKIECQTKEPDRARHPFNDVGGCGKYHKELVHAGCGGPYMLLDPVILG